MSDNDARAEKRTDSQPTGTTEAALSAFIMTCFVGVIVTVVDPVGFVILGGAPFITLGVLASVTFAHSVPRTQEVAD